MAIYHKCHSCGFQRLQETRATPQGLSFNAAAWEGWTRDGDKNLLCPKCSQKGSKKGSKKKD